MSSKFQILFQIFHVPVDSAHFFGDVDSLRTVFATDSADSPTLGGYIDSILMEHLETHREEITKLYNREWKRRNGKNLMEF